MRHIVPIYNSTITVDIYKKTKIQFFNKDTFLDQIKLELIVVKGFTIPQIVEKNLTRIKKYLSEKRKLSESEIIKISKVELICQLGHGVDFND